MRLLQIFLIILLTVVASNGEAASLSAKTYGYSGKGKTTCGGVVKGKLQKSCGTKTAIFQADAVGKCPKGSFFDLTKWSCWTCPDGFARAGKEKYDINDPREAAKAALRILVPVDGPRACVKRNVGKKSKMKKASYQGNVCPKGSFFDPTRGGECWSCPKGYERGVAPVEWKDACVKNTVKKLSKAKKLKRGTGVFKTQCAKGQFWNIGNGYCYSCPKGYFRTATYSIDSKSACIKYEKSTQKGSRTTKATLTGKAQCKPGEFADIRNGGECWTCPTNYDRTLFKVNGKKACEVPGGWDFAEAGESSPLTCQSGQIFDLVNAKHKKVRALYKKQFGKAPPKSLGKKGGGTCWSCPTGYRRTVTSVWSKGACESNGITWKPPVYHHPGLFGLDGSVTVVRDLIQERKLINQIAAATAKSMKKTVAEAKRDVWVEISEAPTESGVLKLAVFSRLQAAAAKTGSISTAEKKLLADFQDAVVHYRTFLANQALDAYEAWDTADKKKTALYKGVMVAGVTTASIATGFGASAGIYAMGAEALRNELWPLPDFTDITLRSVIEDELKGEALGFVYTKMLLSPTVLKKIFPVDAAAAKATKKALTESTEYFQKKLGKYLLQKLSKKVAKKAAASGAKVTAKMVAKAFASAGPQIMIELAIDTVVAYIEMQIERANAKPRLKANVAEAKRPFKVARLLETVQGSREVNAQWVAAMGGAGKLSKKNKARITKDAKAVVRSLIAK